MSTPIQTPPQPEQNTPSNSVEGLGGWMLLLAILMTGVLFTASATLPWALLTLAFSLASIVLAIIILHRLSKAGARGFAKSWAVTMLIFASLSTLFTLGTIVLQPIVGPFQECVRNSVTLRGVDDCQSEYQKSLERLQNSAR